MSTPSRDEITAALATVNDPEIRRPITELGMVEGFEVTSEGRVTVDVLLTTAGCPLKDTLTRDITAALLNVDGVTSVGVRMGAMNAEQRAALQTSLRGGQAPSEIPFAKPDSLTKVYAVASGKGGVGKSSVTVNLAVAMAQQGLKVGIVDADIYGHSVPAMLGVTDLRPTRVEDMYMPVPTEAGPSVISMAVLKPNREDVIPWRGPMLDRALVQMLSDFYWGDIDALFLDLPPGTGDMAISLGQHLPNAEVIVVTTPQEAAAEVAERAGAMAQMMHQRIVGVIENMAYLPCPHCGDEHRIEVFGSGGGDRVAEGLSLRLGTRVPVLGRIPLDLTLREGGDSGRPIVITDPDSPTAQAFTRIATSLKGKGRGLAGRMLNLTPVTGR
jgi:ATP-binding protein involved in chromosome partitioning